MAFSEYMNFTNKKFIFSAKSKHKKTYRWYFVKIIFSDPTIGDPQNFVGSDAINRKDLNDVTAFRFSVFFCCCKFFIMSTEFDKNISDWRYDCTDWKNRFDCFMRLVKWPKIAVKKWQNLIYKVNFQRKKSSESL